MVVLEEQIEVRGYGLVIVDTLSRAAGMADQMDIAQMTGLLGPLQRIAQTYNMTILVVDHHRKSSGFAENPIDDIMGSTAKSAICDAALGLYKQQGKRGATLMLTGRDHGEPLFLQIKEAVDSVLEAYLPVSEYGEHGERVVAGQRLLQASSDAFLGWSATEGGHEYYWRQFHDMKGSAGALALQSSPIASGRQPCRFPRR